MSRDLEAIRRCLRRAWTPFFARFGKLLPVQVETIPKVLDRANVVVLAPTASGKTEAVVAPLAERFVAEGWEGLAILYVVPTRALANDALERVSGPLYEMGIHTQLKHGDKPLLRRKDSLHCLITTPESLDSLVCRQPKIFRTLRAVVIDELHSFDNTYRGDQLRVLLRRLRLLTGECFATYLLSATLQNPNEVGERYIEGRFEIVGTQGHRSVEFCIVNSHQEVLGLARERGWRKILYFCNSRKAVESTAALLSKLWQPYPVVAHHGSLSRVEREAAEGLMKSMRAAVCVATSTLELGIDIGDIDLVVLAEPPLSVTSLLQRIGRGCRRSGSIYAVAIANSEVESKLLELMCVDATHGRFLTHPYVPDASVLVQQIFSILFQHSAGVTQERLYELLSCLFSEEIVREVLIHLKEEEWIEFRAGYWLASTRLRDRGERGQIHSNIPDEEAFRVIDTDSGKEIGKIGAFFDNVFVLGGRAWKVLAVRRGEVRVQRVHISALPSEFHPRRHVGKFYWLLPAKVKERMCAG